MNKVPSVCDSDRLRIEWCIDTLRSVADNSKNKMNWQDWSNVIMVIGGLKRVLEDNIDESN